MERVFTDEELLELSKAPSERVRDAIRTGDVEKALAAFEVFNDNFNGTHDSLAGWVLDMMSYIYDKMGTEGLTEAMRAHTEAYMPWMVSEFNKGDIRHQVEFVVHAGMGMHNTPVQITEDEKKISVKMCPCTSGEALLKKGAYAEGALGALCEASDLTWSIDNFLYLLLNN